MTGVVAYKGKFHEQLCVRQRLACSAEGSPAGVKSQESRSLDGNVAGNRDAEAYRLAAETAAQDSRKSWRTARRGIFNSVS